MIMKNVLLNKKGIYRENNFIKVGGFKQNPLYMGIDKLSFICDIESKLECWDIYDKFRFLTKEKSNEYYIKKVRGKNYRSNVKITSKENSNFYLLVSYDPVNKNSLPNVRFELSPQYGKNNDIFNIVEWLKDTIGRNTISQLFKKARVTRIDLTVDIHSKKFITNYYFSISKAKTGTHFKNNRDDCKNNYAIGSKRSQLYLLVYEKTKLYTSEDYKDDLISVKEQDIKERITRLELRIKPKNKDKEYQLSKLSKLQNPFRIINIYSQNLVENRLNGFLPFLQQEKVLPKAVTRYLETQNGSSRYNRAVLNEILDGCQSKYRLDIDWTKWKDIVRILEPFYK